MKLRNTFLLMLVFLVLGTISVFDPFHWKTKREEAKERDHHLFWLKDSKITTLSITSKDGNFDLGCDVATGCPLDSQGNWHVQRPVVDVADESAVGALLVSLKNSQVVETLDLEDPGKFGEYGLDAPQIQLTFHLQGDPAAHFLKIGKPTAIGPNLYALSSDRPKEIFIIPTVFTNVVNGDLFHWRNKRLFPDIGVNDLDNIAWGEFEFQKDKNDWSMRKPLVAKANSVVVGGLASTLTYLNAKSVFAENQSTPDALHILKTKPVMHFQLEGAKQKKYSLELFHNTGEDFIARVSGKPGLYAIDSTGIARFQKERVEYRERKLLSAAERNAIDKIEFDFPRDKRKVQFTRDGAKWKSIGASDSFSNDRINGFLEVLESAEIENFVKKSSAKLVDLSLTLFMGKEEKHYHFSIDGKQNVLTDGELPTEQRRFGLDVLRRLPVRYADLLEANNKKVITSEPNGKYPEPTAQ